MPLTTLDPTSALIVVDLQKGLASFVAEDAFNEVVRRSRQLADAFRRRGLPVVLVNVAGGAPGRTEHARTLTDLPGDWTELLPQLDPQTTDHRVTKRTWGAFTRTDLEDYLRSKSVTQVVIAGIATSVGVESTARQAHELGFNVTLAVDAMTDPNPQTHHNSVTGIFPRLGETGTTAQILALLCG
jgi:nicotinamidase-related amidase